MTKIKIAVGVLSSMIFIESCGRTRHVFNNGMNSPIHTNPTLGDKKIELEPDRELEFQNKVKLRVPDYIKKPYNSTHFEKKRDYVYFKKTFLKYKKLFAEDPLLEYEAKLFHSNIIKEEEIYLKIAQSKILKYKNDFQVYFTQWPKVYYKYPSSLYLKLEELKQTFDYLFKSYDKGSPSDLIKRYEWLQDEKADLQVALIYNVYAKLLKLSLYYFTEGYFTDGIQDPQAVINFFKESINYLKLAQDAINFATVAYSHAPRLFRPIAWEVFKYRFIALNTFRETLSSEEYELLKTDLYPEKSEKRERSNPWDHLNLHSIGIIRFFDETLSPAVHQKFSRIFNIDSKELERFMRLLIPQRKNYTLPELDQFIKESNRYIESYEFDKYQKYSTSDTSYEIPLMDVFSRKICYNYRIICTIVLQHSDFSMRINNFYELHYAHELFFILKMLNVFKTAGPDIYAPKYIKIDFWKDDILPSVSLHYFEDAYLSTFRDGDEFRGITPSFETPYTLNDLFLEFWKHEEIEIKKRECKLLKYYLENKDYSPSLFQGGTAAALMAPLGICDIM
jgi:hypothetical protein